MSFKTQLPRNLFCQGGAFLSQVAVGLLLVPYLIHHLGAAAFGIIPLAGLLTEYASIISQSVSGAVNRFLTLALQRNDNRVASEILSTAFFSYLALGILQAPVFIFLVFHVEKLINIPAGLHADAVILLGCSAVAFLVNLVGSVFTVPMYAFNRLDILRGLDIGRYGMRLIGIAGLFVLFGPALRLVGYVDVSVSLILCLVQIWASKRLAPSINLRLRLFEWKRVQELVGMGWWLLVNNLGSLLFLRMDIWVCNRFISPEAAGNYAAILQWATLMRSAGAIISVVTAPMKMIYYARGEMAAFLRLSEASVRVLGLVMALPIAIICVYSRAIINLWLGQSYAPLAPLLIIMVCHLVVNVGVLPLINVQVALNKVRVPALVALSMGLINVGLAISFAGYLGWGMFGVAIAGALVLTAKNGIFIPLYAARILQKSWYTFILCCVPALVLLLGLLIVGFALSRFVSTSSLLLVVLQSVGMGLVGVVATGLLLRRNEQQVLLQLLPSGIAISLRKVFDVA